MISDYTKYFQICGTGQTCYESPELCAELKPDLIIMNQDLPGMSRIDPIGQIKNILPKTVFILLTSSEEDITNIKNKQENIFAQLSKPLRKENFLQTMGQVSIYLNGIRESIRIGVKKAQLEYDNQISTIRKILSKALWSNISVDMWNQFKKLTGINTDKVQILLVGFERDKDMDKERLFALLKDLASRMMAYGACPSLLVGQRLIFLLPETNDSLSATEKIKEIAGSAPYEWIITEGRYYSYKDINQAYLEAIRHYKNDSPWFPFQAWYRDQLRCLLSLLQQDSWEKFDQFFVDFQQNIRERVPFSLFINHMTECYILIFSSMRYFDPSYDRELVNPSDDMAVIQTEDQWEQWNIYGLEIIHAMWQNNRSLKISKPLRNALDYIEANYTSSIFLGKVADACHISSGYLSHLFSEQLNTTFVDYLNNYRINRAIDLIRDKKLTIKEVAFQIGYKDPNYFSRIFKKHRGINPSELV